MMPDTLHGDNEFVQEVSALTEKMLNSELSSEQLDRLEHLICSYPECSVYYVQILSIHASLTVQLIPANQKKQISFQTVSDMTEGNATSCIVNFQDYDGLSTTPVDLSPSNKSFQGLIALMIVALLFCGSIFGLWWGNTQHTSQIAQPLAESTAEIAKTERHNTQFIDSASRTQLDPDTIKVSIPNVGYAIINGPADFEMVTPMLARLKNGRINVHVTEKGGNDFVVETPHGNLRNLGDEIDLDVSPNLNSGLVVRNGTVNLELCSANLAVSIKRLSQGEGVTFGKSGTVNRVVSIVKGSSASHLTATEISNDKTILIRDVSDSLKTTDTNKFYEIVPRGLKEDAPAYVDRTTTEWNGVSKKGMPSYLIGADYVKTFNDNKLAQNLEISVTLAHPATLYIFYDSRLNVPEWLKKDFQTTNDKIGLEVAPMKQGVSLPHERGPGKNIYVGYSIWKRKVAQPGVVKLGPNMSDTESSGMYGIAAVKLQSNTGKQDAEKETKTLPLRTDIP